MARGQRSHRGCGTLDRQGQTQVTGARWGLDGAEAVLKLRALHGTGDLGDYLDSHFQQEKHRNHDSRYQQPQELAA